MKRIGVVGAGAMGSGIAQVAAQAGLDVVLYDVGEAPLKAGMERIGASLNRLVQRGKLSGDELDAIFSRIIPTTTLGDFLDVEFAIEAAPEVLEVKEEIFRTLDHICPAGTVLATNTSSLSVTEIGALTDRRERVAGMHFFNPVPAMKLVEVVSGAQTSPDTIRRVTELALQLGKTPVQAKDTPGFIVNRIARPFPGEAMRLLGENVADVRQIDRIMKLAGGFRMGPFELMDLVGMDVNFTVNRSVFEQYFYESRFRPHPLQAQMVKANLLGRKTGAGWYRYNGDQTVEGPAGTVYWGSPAPRPADLTSVYVGGDDATRRLVRESGYWLTDDRRSADVVLLTGPAQARVGAYRDGALILVEASQMTTTELAAQFSRPERVVGFGGVPGLAERQLVEVAPGLRTAPAAWEQAAAFFHSLGRETEVVHDGPGLVVARVIACLVNEAAYALMEGVAAAADIDTAMKLGVNYPHGPLEWADTLGPETVLSILEHLHRHTGDDRYRPCPYLRQLVRAGMRFADVQH